MRFLSRDPKGIPAISADRRAVFIAATERVANACNTAVKELAAYNEVVATMTDNEALALHEDRMALDIFQESLRAMAQLRETTRQTLRK